MAGKQYFEHLLDQNEQILKVFKPHKKAIYFSSILPAIFIILFFTVFFGIAGFMAFTMTGDPFASGGGFVAAIVGSIAFVGMIIITFFSINKQYENLWYAYTNKRLIVRKGIFSTSYSTLELKLVGSIVVEESFIDKKIAQNTGSLSFSSPSMPVVNQNTKRFAFAHIEAPYEVYKELTKLIDETKN